MTASITAPTVTAVTDAFRAAFVGPLADWTVLEGLDPNQAYLTRSLTVGGRWDPDAQALTGQEAVIVETTESGAGRRLSDMTLIDCLAYAGGGDTDVVIYQTAVNDALTAVRAALRSITLVAGASALARVTSQQWMQVRDGAGLGIMAAFTVTVTVLP